MSTQHGSTSLILPCPVCGGINLHPAFEQTGSGDSRLYFSCENYCAVPPLEIKFHKGVTYVGWLTGYLGNVADEMLNLPGVPEDQIRWRGTDSGLGR